MTPLLDLDLEHGGAILVEDALHGKVARVDPGSS
jgi:hypothetical protein